MLCRSEGDLSLRPNHWAISPELIIGHLKFFKHYYYFGLISFTGTNKVAKPQLPHMQGTVI